MRKLFLLPLLAVWAVVSLAQERPDSSLMSRMVADTAFEVVPGVTETNIRYRNKAGNAMAAYVLRVRLRKHKLGMEAATPFNRDTFARQTMMEQMKWEDGPGHKVIAGINADFFNMKNGTPEEMVIKDGKILRDTFRSDRGFVGVLKNGKVILGDSLLYERKKKRLKEALGGYNILIAGGREVPQPDNSFSLTRHPRTALGIVNKREVLFVVVDGRQPEHSDGMPLDELAHFMKLLGAKNAINLDGGGSSTFIALNSASGIWVTRNKPSDGAGRPVANGWIIVAYR